MSGRSRPSSASARLLLEEIAVVQHAGHFHDPLQLDLSPAAANLRRPQGLDQVAGLRLQLPLGIQQRLDLFGQAAVGPGPGLLHLRDLRVHLLQRFFHRFDHLLDRRLAFFQVALGRVLKLLQRCLRQVEKRLVVALQGLGGEGFEGVGQLFLRVVQHAQLFLSLFSLLIQGRGELHEFGLQFRFGRLLLVGFFLKLPDLGRLALRSSVLWRRVVRRGRSAGRRFRPFRGRRRAGPCRAGAARPPRRQGPARLRGNRNE